MPLELENTPEAMEARRQEFARTGALAQAGLSQFSDIPNTSALSQITPASITLPELPQTEQRPVPILSSAPARHEDQELRANLEQLALSSQQAFETSEKERLAFGEEAKRRSEEAFKMQEQEARVRGEEAVAERTRLGEQQRRTTEILFGRTGALFTTTAATQDLAAQDRELQRDIQGIKRQIDLTIGQARQAQLERDFTAARENFNVARQLRDQLTQRQQQSFENRLTVGRLEDERRQEEFGIQKTIADFELRTQEHETNVRDKEFNRALQRAKLQIDIAEQSRLGAKLNADEVQRVFDNELKVAEQKLNERQELRLAGKTAADIEASFAQEDRLNRQLQLTGANQAVDNARQAISFVIQQFGGAELADIPQVMKDQFADLESQAGLPRGFITTGLKTQKELATEQKAAQAEATLKSKEAQNEIMNEIRRAQLGIAEARLDISRQREGRLGVTPSDGLTTNEVQGEIVDTVNQLNLRTLAPEDISQDIKPFIKITQKEDTNAFSSTFGETITTYTLIKPSAKQLQELTNKRSREAEAGVETPATKEIGINRQEIQQIIKEALKSDSPEVVVNDLINTFGYQEEAAKRLVEVLEGKLTPLSEGEESKRQRLLKGGATEEEKRAARERPKEKSPLNIFIEKRAERLSKEKEQREKRFAFLK